MIRCSSRLQAKLHSFSYTAVIHRKTILARPISTVSHILDRRIAHQRYSNTSNALRHGGRSVRQDPMIFTSNVRYFSDKDESKDSEKNVDGVLPLKSEGSNPRPPKSQVSTGNGRSPRVLKDESPTFKVARVDYRKGTVEIVNLHTSELLQSMYARDLFSLNLTSRQERHSSSLRPMQRRPIMAAAILPRSDSIVMSFGNVRAIAHLDYVFVMDAHMPYVQDFAHELADVYKNNTASEIGDTTNEPFELVFLEQVLRDTVDSYYRRLRIFDPIVDSFLDKVTSEVYSDTGVHQLVPLKDTMQAFEIQIKQCLECLTALLNDDEEMLSLLLSEQAAAVQTGKQVEFARHEHVELLIGVYARQLGNILMETQYLLGRLQSKQEFVALALSGYRNRMIRMNVHIGIVGMSLALVTTVAGLYGMNLVNGYEESPTAFYNVVAGCSMSALVAAMGAINYISGNNMRKRAAQRLEEIETLSGALSDMCALDYTIKSTVERGILTDKETFRRTMRKARQSKRIPTREVDLLFELIDRVKDGKLTTEDFHLDNTTSVDDLFAQKENDIKTNYK